jgi:hypothetical protein
MKFVIRASSFLRHSCFAAYKATLNRLEGSMFTRLRHFHSSDLRARPFTNHFSLITLRSLSSSLRRVSEAFTRSDFWPRTAAQLSG